ncbi:MAG: cupin domain-containing protein [Haloferacaceae archaeon]
MVRDYDRAAIPSAHDLADAPTVRDEPGFTQSVFRGIDQLIGFSQIGPAYPDGEPHTHPYEQANLLVDGRVDMLIDGDVVELRPYDAVTIPPEVPHTARAVAGESATLVAFWPLREDRLDGTEYQTEFPRP